MSWFLFVPLLICAISAWLAVLALAAIVIELGEIFRALKSMRHSLDHVETDTRMKSNNGATTDFFN